MGTNEAVGRLYKSTDTENRADIFNMGVGTDYYRIDNYDAMSDFFMSITSGSDIWNFLWAQGGISAGRINANHAVFPYYTCDKLSDMRNVTGSYACIAVKDNDKTIMWEPFVLDAIHNTNQRILLKSLNGSRVKFIEVNEDISLAYSYEWTSSDRFGLIKKSQIINLSASPKEVTILEGARNIMCASANADNQNTNSVLLDAYKKSDLVKKEGLALFGVSSVLTDKAEPSEGLAVNISYFTGTGSVYLGEMNAQNFYRYRGDTSCLDDSEVLKGERASFYIVNSAAIDAGQASKECIQVFDTNYSSRDVADFVDYLKKTDRDTLHTLINEDIEATNSQLDEYIRMADGEQSSALSLTTAHHKANVMFNIMRGGIFADYADIDLKDFCSTVNKADPSLKAELDTVLSDTSSKTISRTELLSLVQKHGNPQLIRLFWEYMSLTFSRRHGDPSRPWNRFNIVLKDKEGGKLLNYEGNWRDIFQNWEALGWSYPEYVESMYTKFVNAMTIDGFNPYRITKDGIDYEIADPDDPWSQYGYWGDHQVIYLQKLLELQSKIDRTAILDKLDTAIYSTVRVPYKLKSYEDIKADPRHSLVFDVEDDKQIRDDLAEKACLDYKLIHKDGSVALITLTAKLLQLISAKAAYLVPGAGIWMNTQRPEWNDANNALAGWGLSVVTTGYLNRMLEFLTELYEESSLATYNVPAPLYNLVKCLTKTYNLQSKELYTDGKEQRNFLDANSIAFQNEYNAYYSNNFDDGFVSITKEEVLEYLKAVNKVTEETLRCNKREDGLYHTYNTLSLEKGSLTVRNLQEMLEGQVSILSSGLLSPQEALEVLRSLKSSAIYESHQNSYMLYPNRELQHFTVKNCITPASDEDAAILDKVVSKGYMEKSASRTYHFAPQYRNFDLLKEDIIRKEGDCTTEITEEIQYLSALYEKTFNHASFTGRSGTFYAYEGLGSIYWHMVSKLLLACQEHALKAYREDDEAKDELMAFYFDIQGGLSFNKTPALYGAVPLDPYSHTPYMRGARQPGMTGQVKEEILTRWGELGVDIHDGKAIFAPYILDTREFGNNTDVKFTWCTIPVTYHNPECNPFTKDTQSRIQVTIDGVTTVTEGNTLTREATDLLIARDNKRLTGITLIY